MLLILIRNIFLQNHYLYNLSKNASPFLTGIFRYSVFLNIYTIFLSPIHLPLIMLLNTPYSLWQCSRLSMQMIWMGCFVLMKYHAVSLCRIIRIMQIPVMTSISGLHRYIMLAQHNNVEILRIDFL